VPANQIASKSFGLERQSDTEELPVQIDPDYSSQQGSRIMQVVYVQSDTPIRAGSFSKILVDFATKTAVI